jgi:hypothetical protein
MLTKEALTAILRQKNVMVGLASSLSGVAGAAVGYLVTKKVLEARYETIIAQEIVDAKLFYANLYQKPDLAELAGKYEEPNEPVTEENIVAAASALRTYQGRIPYDRPAAVTEMVAESKAVVDDEGEGVSVTVNVFHEAEKAKEAWDFEEELAHRTETEPFILHHDEYYEGEKDYIQSSLTYFEGDDVLVDDKQVPIPDSDSVVGDENLRRFGHGSRDNNLLYIRNDRMEIDFEVVRSTGSYTKEVLGFLEHADRPGSRKERRMRRDDE